MAKSNLVLSRIEIDRYRRANETTIECEATERQKRIYRILPEFIPVFQVVKYFAAQETKPRREDHKIPHPVVRPYPNHPLFGNRQFLLVLFPPFYGRKNKPK